MKNKLLEYAALSGDWGVVKNKLTLEDLKVFRKDGENLLETLGANDNILKLPKELIGEDGLLYTDKELTIRLIQLVAEKGSLSIIPKKYLTQENLSAKHTTFGYTTFHYAARHGCLNAIPPYFLSERNLMDKANNDQTPLELAVGMVIALRKCKDTDVINKVKKVKNGINIILNNIRDKTLQVIKTWYVDKEILGYINKEISKRKIIKAIQSEEKNLEL